MSDVPGLDPTANVLQLVTAAIGRLDDLRVAEMKRQEDLHGLTMSFWEKLREAESKRIDAVRAVDVAAVAVASEKAAQQAAVLASQVQATAEALSKRLTDLERSRDSVSGKSAGISMVAAVALGVVTLLGGLVGIAGVLYALLKGG